jgi:nucleotide-binding universal stress UspA family protein
MFHTFKKILVHVDSMATEHPALDRAVELARHLGSALKIVDVVEDLPRHARLFLPHDLQTLVASERVNRLAAIAARVSDASLEVTHEALGGRPADAIVREVLRGAHDVLLSSHPAHDDERLGPLYTALNMQLLRRCPSPVWLVGPNRPLSGRLLAAVDPSQDDPVEHGLNTRILETALWLAAKEYREATILHVWKAFGAELLKSQADDEDVTTYVDSARSAAKQDLDALLASFAERLGGVRVQIEEGDPGTVIPTYALEQGIDLVVMGTVARTGISGFIMGNTAEQVLAALSCSVLTVKPEGFVCPVTLED